MGEVGLRLKGLYDDVGRGNAMKFREGKELVECVWLFFIINRLNFFHYQLVYLSFCVASCVYAWCDKFFYK